MHVDDLVARHPRMFHVSEAGTWPLILRHGLLTTQQIVRTALLPPRRVEELLTTRREAALELEHPVLGTVVIRDQSALNPRFLEPALVDVAPEEWVRLLNQRAFLWPDEESLERFLAARAYRGREHEVIEFDTAEVVARWGERIRLSAILSGAALRPNASPRGSHSFLTVDEFGTEPVSRRRGLAEVALIGGIPDVRGQVRDVRRMRAPTPALLATATAG